MTFETKRLLLRPWSEADAPACYELARDERVGPIAGWPPHKSVEDSRRVIREVFADELCWAIVSKEDGVLLGCIALKTGGKTDMTDAPDECELGYWLGVPWWGRGIMPEAAAEILRHAFGELGMSAVWCGYYAGNDRSKRVQEKLGFRYYHTTEGLEVPLLGETRTGVENLLTREEWEKLKK